MTTNSFSGNVNLKDVNVNVRWTQERLDEYERCANDPDYFIYKYFRVRTLDEGVVGFKMWGFQQRLLHAIHENRFTATLFPRQSGKTTVVAAYFLHTVLFNKDKYIGILANKKDLAIDILSRIQLAFELLPKWLQQGIKVWNKTSIMLENGCKIEAHATSGASVRGKSFNIMLLDEFAHIENNLAEKFWTSTFPAASAGETSKIIIVSTPNGINLFQEIWSKAKLAPVELQVKYLPEDQAKEFLKVSKLNEPIDKDWNQFVPCEVHYTEHPDRCKPEWAEKMISMIGPDRFAQEFECEFLGSGSTLIAGRFLKTIITKSPVYTQNYLDVWEDPQVDIDPLSGIKSPHAYVICVDTARGKQLDYSALVVIDVTDSPYKIVAKYRSNIIPTVLFADVIVPIAKRFNDASIMIELDGPGYQVADDLQHNHEYPNILMVATKGRSGQILSTGFGNTGKNVQRGLKMSTPVRRTGCANLKTMVETKKLLFCDLDIKQELSTFSLKGEKYEAEPGHHDDLVMTLVVFSWLTTQKHFRDLMEAKLRMSLQVDFDIQLNHDQTPYGWIVDGREQDEPEVFAGDLWNRVGDDMWSRFEADRLREYTNYETDALDRLGHEFGW